MGRVGKRLGDTLIEVTIAVGIFSLVAVAVVSVVSSSTSGAQANLETTVTREEIDTQAEALRFIQNAYINGNAGGDKYASVWKAIVDESNLSTVNDSFTPSTCSQIYDKPEESELKNAFIINYRELSSGDPEKIVLKASDNPSMFTMAQTFPRLAFDNKTDNSSILDEDNFSFKTLKKAEGLYVIVARDADSTTIAEGDVTKQSSAYYDFYIRSCWYAASNSTPSTISTVIRLYDPDIVSEGDPIRGKSEWGVTYHSSKVKNICTQDSDPAIPTSDDSKNYGYWPSGAQITAGSTGNLHKNTFTKKGYTFIGWCSKEVSIDSPDVCDGTTYGDEAEYTIPLSLKHGTTNFYAMWKQNNQVKIKYNGNGATSGADRDYDYRIGCTVKVQANWYKKTGYSWVIWNTKKDRSGTDKGVNATFPATQNLTLYAIWEPRYYDIIYKGNGNTGGSTANQYNKLAGSSFTLSPNGFTKVHTTQPDFYKYSFNGWKCKSGCSYIKNHTDSKIYANKEKITVKDEALPNNKATIELEAQWKETKYYKVQYHGNGGKGSEYNQTQVINQEVSILENRFTNSGYDFVGWCYKKSTSGSTAQACKDAGGTYYSKGSKFKLSSVDTAHFYAIWKKSCASTTRSWGFSGEIKTFKVPEGCGGTYTLKVWGAQGGGSGGGYGGYAYGKVTLSAGDTLYIAVGGRGGVDSGGYNGGGSGGGGKSEQKYRYGGGGATHIGKENKLLKLYSWNTKTNLYIVAGGGGGSVYWEDANTGTHDGKTYCKDYVCDKYGSNGFDGCKDAAFYPYGLGGWIEIPTVAKSWISGGSGSGSNGGDGSVPGGGSSIDSSCRKADDTPNYQKKCKERFARVATGGGMTENSGGLGSWGMDHYDPSVTVNSGKCWGYGQNGWCNYHVNGSGAYYGNFIGDKGTFGQGGSGATLKRKMPEYNDNYGIKDVYYNARNSSEYNGGGGGGFYGGGAGAPSGCFPSSGGGGSGWTTGLSNPQSGTSDKKTTEDHGGNGYAQIIGPE